MFKTRFTRGGYTKRTNVDCLKYDEKIGAIIAVDVYGHDKAGEEIREFTALLNLGYGESPNGETEGGIWAIDRIGNVYWIRHTADVYELNLKGEDNEIDRR